MGWSNYRTAAQRVRFQRSQVWVVVPAHNEAKYIERVLTKLRQHNPNIILVDDGSQDETATLAADIAHTVLRHQVNLGKGAALKTGCDWAFDHAGAEAVVLLDGDDQHDPALLDFFIQPLTRSAEVVFGVRDFLGMPLVRQVGNQFGSLLVLALFGRYLPDIPSGYKSFTKRAYEQLRWYSMGYSVEMEIATRVAKSKLPVVSVPIPTIYHDLTRGMTILDTLHMIGLVISWRFSL